jgi:rare lipoprotein A
MPTPNLLQVILVTSIFLSGTRSVLAMPSSFPFLSFLSSSLPTNYSGSNPSMTGITILSSSTRWTEGSDKGADKGLFPAFQFGPASMVEGLMQRSGSPELPAVGVVGNLFQQTIRTWFDEVGVADSMTTGPMVMAVRSGSSPSDSEAGGRSIPELRQTFWKCSPKSGNKPKTEASNGRFQVWLKGCEVAEFPTKDAADRFSKGLQQALKMPDADFSKLQPAFEGDIPVMKLGNQVLFTVSPELALALDRNAELLAIEWTNHVRVALGQAELGLAQAQAKMYGLEDTATSLDGVASWYGPYFHGRITATGEVYNQYDLTAASRTLPFDTFLRVTNRKNGKSVVVRINDRGPYVDEHLRILDLSYRAATMLGSDESGIVPIDAVILKPAPGSQIRIGQKVPGVTL